MSSPNPDRCGSCRYFAEHRQVSTSDGGSVSSGACRRHAPRLHVDEDHERGRAWWPPVWSDQFCGDFERAVPSPSPVEPKAD